MPDLGRSDNVHRSYAIRHLPKPPWRRILLGVAILAVFLVTTLILWRAGALEILHDGEKLEQAVVRLGPYGPALIIGLMTVAIVMSPIPSAPIALASGAAYGHVWGTLYVAIGSEAGALIAFAIARLLGREALTAWLKTRLTTGFLNRFVTSQNALMLIVFITRLMPFLSFDLVSYAAGLTPLKVWRFALATLLGILPASFLLAHFGAEIASGDWQRVALTVLALGTITLLPFAWRMVPSRYRRAVKLWVHLG